MSIRQRRRNRHKLKLINKPKLEPNPILINFTIDTAKVTSAMSSANKAIAIRFAINASKAKATEYEERMKKLADGIVLRKHYALVDTSYLHPRFNPNNCNFLEKHPDT